MPTRTRIQPSRRRSPQANRRRTSWARVDDAIVPVNAGATSDLLSDFRTALGWSASPPGVTVGGVLLDFVLTQTAARAAAGDGVYIGLIVTSEGTAGEVERPLTDLHADWMWWQFIGASQAASGAGYSTFDALGGPIRIRSKRRMDEVGMRLWLVAQSSGTTTWDLQLSASTLLLMP